MPKKTTKRPLDSTPEQAVKPLLRKKRKGGVFWDLVGKAPLHMDPVKFQRMLRDEE